MGEQWSREVIASGIDNEGFDYWLEEYYIRGRCGVLSEDTLNTFDAVRTAMQAARAAAEGEGLFA